MCDRNSDPTTYDEHQEEVTQFVREHATDCTLTPAEDRIYQPTGRVGDSPWVKRCLDYAQYAQPRGSQYEG